MKNTGKKLRSQEVAEKKWPIQSKQIIFSVEILRWAILLKKITPISIGYLIRVAFLRLT